MAQCRYQKPKVTESWIKKQHCHSINSIITKQRTNEKIESVWRHSYSKIKIQQISSKADWKGIQE